MGGASCKLKIIMNGATIQSELNKLCYMVDEIPYETFPDQEGLKMVELLNRAEDIVFRAKRVFLESQGFHGPWPHSLS